MALKMALRNASGINGLAGPLLISTMRLAVPMSIRLKLRPDLASSLMRRKSGSRACAAAIAFQSMPKVLMAFTTQLRSSSAACRRAAALGEGVGDAGATPEVDESVEDADASSRIDERVGDAETDSRVDERVE